MFGLKLKFPDLFRNRSTFSENHSTFLVNRSGFSCKRNEQTGPYNCVVGLLCFPVLEERRDWRQDGQQ